MAFTITDDWTVSRFVLIGNVWHAMLEPFDDLFARWTWMHRFSRPGAATISVAVHIFVVGALLQNGLVPVDNLRDLTNRKTESILTVFDIAEKKPPPPAGEPEKKMEQAPARGTPRNITITKNAMTPPEWTVSRIGIAAGRAGGQRSNIVGIDGIGKDGGVYDPYAGTSPNRQDKGDDASRRDINAILAELSEVIDPQLDKAAFAKLVLELRTKLGRTRGSVELLVDVDNSGKIYRAELQDSTASLQLKLFVRRMVVGKNLYLAGSAGQKKLPVILI